MFGIIALAGFWHKCSDCKIAADCLVNEHAVEMFDLRRNFQREFKVQQTVPVAEHPHGELAAERTAASRAMDDWIYKTGFKPYVVSFSSHDSDKRGYHGYYEARDIRFEPRIDPLERDDIVKMVDCDYYVDINQWLDKGQPLLIYTMDLSDVAGRIGEGWYRFKDGQLEYHVASDGYYRHSLWDYNNLEYVLNNRGILFVVERQRLPMGHQVVLISPIRALRARYAYFWTPGCYRPNPLVGFRKIPLISNDLLSIPTRRITRLQVLYGGVNIMRVMENQELMVKLAVNGSYTSVAIKQAELDALVERFKISDGTVATVERYLTDTGALKKPHIAAPLLLPWLKQQLADVPVRKAPVLKKPVSFEPCGNPSEGMTVHDDGGKEVGRVLGPCIVTNPAVIPRNSINSDIQAVLGRIDHVYNDKVPPTRYTAYGIEFVKMVVGPSVLQPWTREEVVELQKRPLQRQRNKLALIWAKFDGYTRPRVRAFVKKEAYGKVTDPRNISQLPVEHNLNLAQYVYPFSSFMKRFAWYMPGKDPKTIADLVHKYCKQHGGVTATDYSRWDGSLSLWMRRNIELNLLQRAFKLSERPRIQKLVEDEFDALGVTQHGHLYDPKSTRLSGSLLTSWGNTVMNAFVSYCAYRDMGMTKLKAFESIGPTCGDDGLTAAGVDFMERCAKQLGLKLKAKLITAGNVPFLGRIFINPFENPCSIQDPLRTLQKLTYSFAPQEVSDNAALYNRAIGYLATDGATPIISDWCKYQIARLQRIEADIDNSWAKQSDLLLNDSSYYGVYCRSFPDTCWPQLECDSPMVIDTVARSLGTDNTKVEEYVQYIRGLGPTDEITRALDTPPIPITIRACVRTVTDRGVSGEYVGRTCEPSRRVERQLRRKNDSQPNSAQTRRQGQQSDATVKDKSTEQQGKSKRRNGTRSGRSVQQKDVAQPREQSAAAQRDGKATIIECEPNATESRTDCLDWILGR